MSKEHLLAAPENAETVLATTASDAHRERIGEPVLPCARQSGHPAV